MCVYVLMMTSWKLLALFLCLLLFKNNEKTDLSYFSYSAVCGLRGIKIATPCKYIILKIKINHLSHVLNVTV